MCDGTYMQYRTPTDATPYVKATVFLRTYVHMYMHKLVSQFTEYTNIHGYQ